MSETKVSSNPGAVLGAEVGSVWTRTLLMDIVDDEYRIVARNEGLTTLGSPVNDVVLGLVRLLRDMTQSGVRRLLDDRGQLIIPERSDRSGVDHFVATTSAGRTLRAVLIGLLPTASLEAAQQALRGAAVDIVEAVHLLDGRDEEGRLNALILSRPDLVLIVGGTEGGAQARLKALIKEVQFAVALTDRSLRPVVVYSGNHALADEVQQRFEGLCECIVTPNLMPEIGLSSLGATQNAISSAYDAFFRRRDVRFSALGSLSAVGLRPSTQSYTLLARYWQKTLGQRVALVDLGSASAQLVYADGEGPLRLRVDTRLGQGHSAEIALETLGQAALERWLPFYPQPDEVANYAINKTLRPATVPMEWRELYLEHALARANLRRLLADAQLGDFAPQRLLLSGSTLTRSGEPFYDLLLLADGLQPHGVTEVYSDTQSSAAVLGAVAQVNSAAFVQVAETAFTRLGVLISLEGALRPERRAARLKIRTEEGQTFRVDVKGGHVVSLPLPESSELLITLTTSGGARVGKASRLRLKLKGGTAGILIDARGRSFEAGSDVAQRAERLPLWWHEATDQPLPSLPTDWLIPPEVVLTAESDNRLDAEEGQPRRRRLFASAPKRLKDAPAERGGRRGKAQQASAASSADDLGLDDEFAALIGEEPRKADGKKQTGPIKEDDMGNLRDLL